MTYASGGGKPAAERQPAWLVVTHDHLAFYPSQAAADLNKAALLLPCASWEVRGADPAPVAPTAAEPEAGLDEGLLSLTLSNLL
jgi:hypothetical protein